MNKLYILSSLMICLLFLGACDEFLEQESQNLISPKKVEHYKELLVGEGNFNKMADYGRFIEYMTDNVEFFKTDNIFASKISSNAIFAKDCYQWQSEIEESFGSDYLYRHLYRNILAANTCLSALGDMVGTEEDKRIMEAQALFVRAYAHFVLSNLYAQAYNEADESDLCIQLKLDPTPILELYNRNTIKEVWTQIKNDIELSVEKFSKTMKEQSVYEVNSYASLLLAARVNLFMENYDATISYCEKFLEAKYTLYDISEGLSGDNSFLDPFINPEVVYNFGSSYEYSFLDDLVNLSSYSLRSSESVENALMQEYQEGDGRKYGFFEPPVEHIFAVLAKPRWFPAKYDKYDKSGVRQSFRTAEVYLMMAEAYSRKDEPDNAKAISYLNDLRINRLRDIQKDEDDNDIKVFVPLKVEDFSTQEELVQFVWDERRRELCFEEFHRWWDLRRIGQPAIKHMWEGNAVYELQKGDMAYILNFPKEERDFNAALEGNARPNREPINN